MITPPNYIKSRLLYFTCINFINSEPQISRQDIPAGVAQTRLKHTLWQHSELKEQSAGVAWGQTLITEANKGKSITKSTREYTPNQETLPIQQPSATTHSFQLHSNAWLQRRKVHDSDTISSKLAMDFASRRQRPVNPNYIIRLHVKECILQPWQRAHKDSIINRHLN